MPYFVKRFRHIKIDRSYFEVFRAVKTFEDFMNQINKLISNRVTWSKTRLIFSNKIISKIISGYTNA